LTFSSARSDAVTESEWLASSDPAPMLEYLRGKVSDRKLRLFAVACVRRVGRLLIDKRSVEAVDLAERFADGLVPRRELTAKRKELNASVKGRGTSRFLVGAQKAALAADWPKPKAMVVAQAWTWAWECSRELMKLDAVAAGREAAMSAECAAANDALEYWGEGDVLETTRAAERKVQAGLLRCVVGNPLRPRSALDPAWRTPTVLSLAQAGYDERLLPSGELEHERLVVLADALEQAGCTNAELLGHLRGPGPHVRGCFVLDLVLGLS
jgi:hypothetical protein